MRKPNRNRRCETQPTIENKPDVFDDNTSPCSLNAGMGVVAAHQKPPPGPNESSKAHSVT